MVAIMRTHRSGSTTGPSFDVAVIAGVNFSFPEVSENITVETPFGVVRAYPFDVKGRNCVLIPRHADGQKHLPPHMVNYRAIIWAVMELGIERAISVNSVGTMQGHPIGSFVLPDDLVDMTRNRISTFHDNRTVHVDMTEPYCPQIRQSLKAALIKEDVGFADGIYVCTEGPRFETRAEIRMMSRFGDVVGMTGMPEVALAKELNLCYASICTVTNNACGMGAQKVTASEVVRTLQERQEILLGVLLDTIGNIPDQRSCNCRYAADTDACL
ncbi:MAG: MTAP family purine nucleoside phosphorylase [Methanolobus sp.]|uniref:MTAP family purine nucleoside phosphorylase n=1 Tax=Methanolobus sp. TaxID=1874737 RepID=UPI00272F74B0|nr:MTAP family purine nucleoside phosphorylase [Methanolobus sp.]MDP2218089.1 MTAP family purine nucleoside phosphorylase [Methanolobus sp.]